MENRAMYKVGLNNNGANEYKSKEILWSMI